MFYLLQILKKVVEKQLPDIGKITNKCWHDKAFLTIEPNEGGLYTLPDRKMIFNFDELEKLVTKFSKVNVVAELSLFKKEDAAHIVMKIRSLEVCE